MEYYRTLDLMMVSAKGLKKSSLMGRMDVYAEATISGCSGKVQRLRTTVDKSGDSDPTWNFPMKFIVEDSNGLQTLVVKIKKVRVFGGGKCLGEVNVPVKELMEGSAGVTDAGNNNSKLKSGSYDVITKSGKVHGGLSFWYEFGDKFTGKPEDPVPLVG
ncbi:protein SRC2-like [Bidens hawaiensis]|uniref:protein SRC2-like n=1 Tax=Bidens hawaiensis TaxID=980011 RepID=UPI004049F62A